MKASVTLTELSDLYQDDRGARWGAALGETPSLRIEGFGYLHLKNRRQDFPGRAGRLDHMSFMSTGSLSPTPHLK